MRTLERSRWSVGEQKNIICSQSCGRFGDGTARCRTLVSSEERCIPLWALDRPSNDLLKSSTVISGKGKPQLKRWSTRIGIGSPMPLRRIIDATT